MLGKLFENGVGRLESFFVLLGLIKFLPSTRPAVARLGGKHACAQRTHARTHARTHTHSMRTGGARGASPAWRQAGGETRRNRTHHNGLKDGRLLLLEDLAVFRGHLADAGSRRRPTAIVGLARPARSTLHAERRGGGAWHVSDSLPRARGRTRATPCASTHPGVFCPAAPAH